MAKAPTTFAELDRKATALANAMSLSLNRLRAELMAILSQAGFPAFTWGNLSGKPAVFAPAEHMHAVEDIVGLDAAAVAIYAAAGHGPGAVDAADVAGFDERTRDTIAALLRSSAGITVINDDAGDQIVVEVSDAEAAIIAALELDIENLLSRVTALETPVDDRPVNTTAPAITGTATPGQTALLSDGVWTNNPTQFAYRLYRNGRLAPGDAGKDHLLVAADVAKTLRKRVLAQNVAGHGVAYSNSFGPVTEPASVDVTGAIFIDRTAKGDGSGSSWPNAASITTLAARIAGAAPGQLIAIRAEGGTYSATSARTLAACGGSPSARVRVKGVNSATGLAARALFVGNRESPFAGGTAGAETFRILAGCNNLEIDGLDFLNIGDGAVRIGADCSNIVWKNSTVTNCARWIECLVSGTGVTSASCAGLVLQNITVLGASRGGRIDYATTSLVEDCYVDMQRINDLGGFAVGLEHRGTSSGIVRRTVAGNSYRPTDPALYANGDAFSDEVNTTLTYEDCIGFGCTDGGFDLKGADTLRRCIAFQNKRNFRLWGRITLLNCLSYDAVRREGSSSAVGLWIGDGAVVTVTDSGLTSANPAENLIELDKPGSTLTLVNVSAQALNGATAVLNAAGGSLTGAPVAAPVFARAPTISGSPVVQQTLTGVMGNTLAPLRDKFWTYVRGLEHVPDSDDLNRLLATADIGAAVALREFVVTPDYHIAQASSAPTAAVAAIAPTVTTAPFVDQFAMGVGNFVRPGHGVYVADPAPAITWQFYLNGVAYGAANAELIAIPTGHATHTFALHETAANVAGTVTTISAASPPITAAADVDLHVRVAAHGDGSGSSMANACTATTAFARSERYGLQGEIKLLNTEGAHSFPVTMKPGHPNVWVHGVNAGLAPARAVVSGGRANFTGVATVADAAALQPRGTGMFWLQAGCDNWTFSHLDLRDARTAILTYGVLDNLCLGDISLKDTASAALMATPLNGRASDYLTRTAAIEAAVSAYTDSAAAKAAGVNFINCYRGLDVGQFIGDAMGLTNFNRIGGDDAGSGRGAMRIKGPSVNCWIQDVDGDAEYQIAEDSFLCDMYALDGGAGGWATNIRMVRCSARNARSGNPEGSYWNGDGFTSEDGNADVIYWRCDAYDTTDGGHDHKASQCYLGYCEAGGNKRNFRSWGEDVEYYRCRSLEPIIRGGTGSTGHFYINTSAKTRALDCEAVASVSSAPMFTSAGATAALKYANPTNSTGRALIGGTATFFHEYDWADVTAPSLTSPDTVTINNGQPFDYTATADEVVDITLTGADAGLVTLTGARLQSPPVVYPGSLDFNIVLTDRGKFWGNVTVVPFVGTFTNLSATDFFISKHATAPTTPQANRVRALIEGLEADGVLPLMLALQVRVAETDQAAMLDIALPTRSSTRNGTVTFVALAGVTGTGVTGNNLDMHLDPSLDPSLPTDLAVGVYVANSTASTLADLISSEGSNSAVIVARNGSNGSVRVRAGTPVFLPAGGAVAPFMISGMRYNATNMKVYRNGVFMADAARSLNASAGNLRCCGSDRTHWADFAMHCGAAVDHDAMQLALYNRLRAYFLSAGLPA